MDRFKQHWWKVPKAARQGIVLVVGLVVIIAGFSLLVLPGPGLLVIFIGMAILAAEFERADRLKQFVKRHIKQAAQKTRRRRRE